MQKIGKGSFRLQPKRQQGGIGSDHAALDLRIQSQLCKAKSFVLIQQIGVESIIAAFAYAADAFQLMGILHMDGTAGGFGEQGTAGSRLKQKGHQVLEHGTAAG